MCVWFVCVCAHQLFSTVFNNRLSGSERNWDAVFLGIWRQGRCHCNHRVNKHDVKHAHKHIRIHLYTCIYCLPRPPSSISHSHSGSTPQGLFNVHSHLHECVHAHTQTHSLSHPLANPFSLCVEWEEGSPQNRLPEKRALPSLRDKHHSVTRFSGHCFLTVYFLLICVSNSSSLSFWIFFHVQAGQIKIKHKFMLKWNLK